MSKYKVIQSTALYQEIIKIRYLNFTAVGSSTWALECTEYVGILSHEKKNVCWCFFFFISCTFCSSFYSHLPFIARIQCWSSLGFIFFFHVFKLRLDVCCCCSAIAYSFYIFFYFFFLSCNVYVLYFGRFNDTYGIWKWSKNDDKMINCVTAYKQRPTKARTHRKKTVILFYFFFISQF